MESMNIREAFSRSQQGNQAAVEAMQNFASMGSKEAEAVMMEEINKARLRSPEATFAEAFARVTDAFPDLHLAYINGNGISRY